MGSDNETFEWYTNRKGNSCLKKDGYHLTVFEDKNDPDAYQFCIKLNDEKPEYNPEVFFAIEEAKREGIECLLEKLEFDLQ